MSNKNLDKLINLGHSAVPSRLYKSWLYQSDFEGWFECTKCNVKVYIHRDNSSSKLDYWQDDMFHTRKFCTGPNSIVEFNLTCDEVLILKILN